MPVKIERAKAVIADGGLKIRRKKLTDPDIDSVFEDDDDPLANIELETGELGIDGVIKNNTNMAEGMSQALIDSIARRKSIEDRFRVSGDPEYFFCVIFQSREQKDEFLKGVGWEDLGDKYMDGLDVAHRLNVPVKVIEMPKPSLRGKMNRFKREDII